MSDFKRIHIALLGSFLQKEEADGLLIEQKSAVRYGDAYWLRYHDGEAWIFNYGVAVCWNMTNDERQELFSMLEPIIHNPVARPLSEQYTYLIDSNAAIKVHHDHIIIDNDDPLSRLAMSHGCHLVNGWTGSIPIIPTMIQIFWEYGIFSRVVTKMGGFIVHN